MESMILIIQLLGAAAKSRKMCIVSQLLAAIAFTVPWNTSRARLPPAKPAMAPPFPFLPSPIAASFIPAFLAITLTVPSTWAPTRASPAPFEIKSINPSQNIYYLHSFNLILCPDFILLCSAIDPSLYIICVQLSS